MLLVVVGIVKGTIIVEVTICTRLRGVLVTAREPSMKLASLNPMNWACMICRVISRKYLKE